MKNDQVISSRTKTNIQDRRNMMIQEHSMTNAMEKQREFEKGMRENMADERFKNRDMLAVHQAALRRMQEKAHKGV